MTRLSLTGRLLILMLISIAPALAVLIYNMNSSRSAAYADLHRTALENGEIANQEIQRIVASAHSTLDVLAESPVVHQDPTACAEFLAAVDRKLDMLANITVLDADGALRCSSNPAHLQSFADRFYYRSAREKQNFVIGSFITDRITGKPSLPLALPSVASNGEEHIIVAMLDLGWLGQRLKERDYTQGNAVTVADREGTIIAREPFPERFVGTRIPPRYINLVKADKPGTIEVESQDGTLRIIGYFPATDGIYVSAGLSIELGMQPVTTATATSMAAGILAVAGIFAAIWVAGSILIRRPAGRLYRTVMAWRRGNTSARTGMRGQGELEMIGAAIDDFMDELGENREQRLKDERLRELLIRELDHRIKNMLATIQAVARQTLQPGRAVEDVLPGFMRRIQAMAGAHQLLTKNWQSASLSLTVATAIAPFHGSVHGTDRFIVEGPDLEVNAGTALSLSMALHELCTNAAKYGALTEDAGRIHIRWSLDGLDRDHRTFHLTWRESDGPPVDKPSREGFGTLMIQRVLSQQLNGSVTPYFEPGGLRVEIDAPACSILAIVTEDAEVAQTVHEDLSPAF